MVEFINRLTESQAPDKVHKVLRADPDKKKNQPEQEDSEFENKDEEEGPKVELLLSKEENKTEEADQAPDSPVDESKNKKIASDKQDNENADGHIDVTV